MKIQPIAADDAQFKELAAEIGSAFVQSWWLDAMGDEIERLAILANDGQLIGGLVLHATQLKGVSCLTNPPFTPHTGLFVKVKAANPSKKMSAEKEVLKCLVGYLESRSEKIIDLRLPFAFQDAQEFYWSDFDVSPRYTYRLDLTRSEDEILSAMDPKTRNAIKAAEGAGVTVDQASSKGIQEGIKAILVDRSAKVRFDLLGSIFNGVADGDSIRLEASCDEKREALSYCIVHGSEAYYLFGGNDNTGSVGSSGSLIMWSAIKKAKSRGLEVFDFEGSMIPGVEKFFRGFGGELITYFAIQKIPLAYRVAAKITGKKF
jgi:hypothetical protein